MPTMYIIHAVVNCHFFVPRYYNKPVQFVCGTVFIIVTMEELDNAHSYQEYIEINLHNHQSR